VGGPIGSPVPSGLRTFIFCSSQMRIACGKQPLLTKKTCFLGLDTPPGVEPGRIVDYDSLGIQQPCLSLHH